METKPSAELKFCISASCALAASSLSEVTATQSRQGSMEWSASIAMKFMGVSHDGMNTLITVA